MIPFLGTAATVLELLFGVTLVLGLALRWAAFGSAGLLFLFGSAMAISFGIKSPFDLLCILCDVLRSISRSRRLESMDRRLVTLMLQWQSAVRPSLLEATQGP